MNRDSVIQSAIRNGVVEEVEEIEIIGNHIAEGAVLVNKEKIYFYGGSSNAYFDVDEFLGLVEEAEETAPDRDNPIEHRGYLITYFPRKDRMYISKEISDTGELFGTTHIAFRTIRDIKDRFKL